MSVLGAIGRGAGYLDEIYAAIQLLGGAADIVTGDETDTEGTIDNPPMVIDGGGTTAPSTQTGERGILDRLIDWLPGGNPPGGAPVAAGGMTLTDACSLFRPAPISVPPDVAPHLARVIDWMRNDPRGRQVGAMFVRSFLGRPCDNVPPASKVQAFGEMVRKGKPSWYKVAQMWRGGLAAPIGEDSEQAQFLWMLLEIVTADSVTLGDGGCSCREG